ncbi:Oxoglutarate/iron-dependent oxygenase [Venturia nashicola]|uniref:Oxoglutarate/iron-dependent oxygenase n=1 Tax=Venturia nashicola TaxID=86259 RepID=A0A4Z1P044_9PEZI|nr:Oxoglutarate/iron-dependent oxygenase [Venturia nashicola]TLD32247.1 Oxoglutarate/iron-dependent oxygenase [Venturia nashicola]
MAPKGKKKVILAASTTERLPLPNWPALQPLLSPLDLTLEHFVPDQIITIPNLWTSTLCKNYVAFLSSLPLTTTPGKPKRGDAVRVNDRYQVDDAAFAERLWSQTALKELVTGEAAGATHEDRSNLWGGIVVGLNPNIRIYRYTKGQFFDQHYDDFNNVVIPGETTIKAKTTWTLLLYLTSPATGCIGGETVFYPDPPKKGKNVATPEPISIGLEVGMALLHKHGKDCMLHEGREVVQGEKWVIRSDLCVI